MESQPTHLSAPSARIPEIDGIRGLAILMIIAYHFLKITGDSEGLFSVELADRLQIPLRIGWTGIDLFFVLSGFLIGGILLKHRTDQNYFQVFYVRRFCRILPLYFVLLGSFVLFGSILRLPFPQSMQEELFASSVPFAGYATFTQNIFMAANTTFGTSWLSPTWSLAVEEQFYLFIPFLIRLVPYRKLPIILIAFILTAPILRVVLRQAGAGSDFAAYVLLPTRMDGLMLGVLIAYLSEQKQFSLLLVRFRPVLYVVWLILLGGSGWFMLRSNSPYARTTQAIGYSWFVALAGLTLVLALHFRNSLPSRFFRIGGLGRVGIWAYSMYLFHYPIAYLCHGLLLNQWPTVKTAADVVVTALAVLLTLVLAALSWRYFEKPFIALGHRLHYRRSVVAQSDAVAVG